MLTTQVDFESHLEENPDDWGTRLVYADWLEEQREFIRANGQRWQVENGKCPSFNAWDDQRWDWWRKGQLNRKDRPNISEIHCIGFNIYYLVGSDSRNTSAEYESIVNAETALAEALHKLKIVSNCNAV